MGIRIKRMLGYGLTDVECEENGEVTDSRFNLDDGWFGLDWEDREDKHIEDYICHLDNLTKSNPDSLMTSIDKMNLEDALECNKRWEFYDVIHHDSEFGAPNVVLFQQWHNDWTRRDDIIDYMEAENSKPSVNVLKRPIYPYDGWIHSETGESTYGETKYKTKDGTTVSTVDTYAKIVQSINMGFPNQTMIEKAGFSSIEEAKEKIIPKIPEGVQEYLKYLKVFKDEKTYLQLRPMIYTYWS